MLIVMLSSKGIMEPHGQARGISISSAKSAEAPSYAQGSRLPKNLSRLREARFSGRRKVGEQVEGLSFSHSSTDKTIVFCVGG
jgi:hypothetical protein